MKTTCLQTIFFALIAFPFFLFSQSIPQDLQTNWSKAGILSELPVYDTIDVTVHGLLADGATSNSVALQNLLDLNVNKFTVFYFPAGNYFFDGPILLNSGQILKGASSEETYFEFDLANETHAINFLGKSTGISTPIFSTINKEASSFDVADGTLFNSGDFIKTQTIDIDLVYSAWAEHSTGQICQVKNVQGNAITIEENIRKNISLADNPLIEKIDPVQFAGVECISINRLDKTDIQTSNIYFSFAANCWLEGVDSRMANFAHVDIENSAHVSVAGCYFQDAHAYGGGGQGYGVVLEFNTSDCLVENNVFNHLRHSMLLQAGANGNVIAHNYSINPHWDEVGLPDDASGDIVLHGNYPYLNLFEENICQNIVVDDSHGSNGPGNVFFRNRAEHYGIYMNNGMPSDNQVFIANEITSTDFLLGYYNLAGSGHYEFGNNVKGNVLPAGTMNVVLGSLYLNDVPDYFIEQNMDIANIGLPNFLNMGSLPAKDRYIDLELTRCEAAEPVIIDAVDDLFNENSLSVFPNPAYFELYFHSDLIDGKLDFKLLDLNGRVVFTKENIINKILLPELPHGIYSAIIQQGEKIYHQKIIIAR